MARRQHTPPRTVDVDVDSLPSSLHADLDPRAFSGSVTHDIILPAFVFCCTVALVCAVIGWLCRGLTVDGVGQLIRR